MAFECPAGTRFQQRTMVCDHEHLVECQNSEKYFHSNLRIGQANLNFIDDNHRKSTYSQLKKISQFEFPARRQHSRKSATYFDQISPNRTSKKCDLGKLGQNSEKYFHSNLRIGQANLNFIDDNHRKST